MWYRQRAFRERKERHIKDIEEKLLSLGKTSHNLRSECERLEHELEKSKAGNETLRMKCGILGQQSVFLAIQLPDPLSSPRTISSRESCPRDIPNRHIE